MLLQQVPASLNAGRFIVGVGRPRLSGQAVQDAEYLVDIGQHMGFGATERRKTEPRQLLLQRTIVDTLQGKVVGSGCGRSPRSRHRRREAAAPTSPHS